MEKVTLFYLKGCPHCKKAFAIMEELKKEDKYKALEVVPIEEREQADIANEMDYYYVPCFYMGNEKLHEGIVTEEDVREVFDTCLNS